MRLPPRIMRRTGFRVIQSATAHTAASSQIASVRGNWSPKRIDIAARCRANAVAQPNDALAGASEPSTCQLPGLVERRGHGGESRRRRRSGPPAPRSGASGVAGTTSSRWRRLAGPARGHDRLRAPVRLQDRRRRQRGDVAPDREPGGRDELEIDLRVERVAARGGQAVFRPRRRSGRRTARGARRRARSCPTRSRRALDPSAGSPAPVRGRPVSIAAAPLRSVSPYATVAAPASTTPGRIAAGRRERLRRQRSGEPHHVVGALAGRRTSTDHAAGTRSDRRSPTCRPSPRSPAARARSRARR